MADIPGLSQPLWSWAVTLWQRWNWNLDGWCDWDQEEQGATTGRPWSVPIVQNRCATDHVSC